MGIGGVLAAIRAGSEIDSAAANRLLRTLLRRVLVKDARVTEAELIPQLSALAINT